MIPWNKDKKQKEIERAIVYDKVCSVCGKNFQTKRETQIYCNQGCYSNSQKLKEEARRSILIKGNSKNKWHEGHIKEDVGYGALHDWIRYNKKKADKCEICGSDECGYCDGRDFELANISGEYKRDVDDFEWLCYKCHRIFDKIKKMKPYIVQGCEVKSDGYLKPEEKEKCNWYLENKIFSKILIAKKGKKRGEIIYDDFLQRFINNK